jgi:hypothetical protein
LLSEAASASFDILFACIIGLDKGKFWCGAIKNSVDGGLSSSEVNVSYSIERKISGYPGQPFAPFYAVYEEGLA